MKATIKWPNDVQVGGKKIAGILTELSAEAERVHFVVLGIGVNLNAALVGLPARACAEVATSRDAGPRPAGDRARCSPPRLWTRLEQWLDVHAARGLRAGARRAGARCPRRSGRRCW